MKKITLVCAIALAMMACNREQTLTKEECDKSKRGLVEERDNLKMRLINKPEAQVFVVVNKTGLPTGWIDTYLTHPDYTDYKYKDIVTLETQGEYYVDLRLITKKDESKVAEWLKDNDTYLKYPETYCMVETAHKVQERMDREKLDSVAPGKYSKGYTWEEIVTVFTGNSPTVNVNDNNFDNYLKIHPANLSSTDPAQKYTLSVSAFTKNHVVYSIPLFRSIINNHNWKGDALFYFAESDYRGKNTTFIKVMDGTDFVGYYDFTHRPNLRLGDDY